MMRQLLAWMPPACAFLFPLHPRATTPLLIAWGVLLLAAWWTHRPAERPSRPAGWWGGPTLYGLLALGLLWSNARAEGLFALEVKAALVLLPLLYWATERIARVSVSRVSVGLMAGLLASAALALGDAAWDTVHSGSWAQWRYAELAGALHPTYLAWYWAFGLFLWLTKSMPRLGLWFALLASAMIGLLASKSGWIAGGATLCWALFKERRVVPAVTGLLILVATGWWAGAGRAVELAEGLRPHSSAPSASPPEAPASAAPSKSGSTSGRLQAWSAAWSIVQGHPFGVGTGSSQRALDDVYAARGDEYAMRHHMNAHNAYLEAAVAWGWLGLTALLAWWGTVAVAAWRFRHLEAMAFIVMAAWIALTESVFELQSGVVWLAFGLYAWGPRLPQASAVSDASDASDAASARV